ncbi:MAG: CvpA family protein [Clostridia bacterium]|nr:CvpA family protein [Clostridia bacterium]
MILDIVYAVVLVLFGLIGFFRGFARQIFGLMSGFVALVGAYFLLMPVYNLLYDLFLGSIIESVGSSLTFLTFLDTFAATAGKTTGVLIMEYLTMFVLYLVLCVLVGFVWKLLKLITHPICDLKGIKFFDKFFGVLLGFVWGVLFVTAIIYLATIVSGWKFIGMSDTVNELIATLSDGSFFSKRFILDHLDKVEIFFADTWELIKKGFNAVKAA